MRDFQQATYAKALVGSYSSIDELRQILVRHLTQQVRFLNKGRPRRRRARLEDAIKLTGLIKDHKEHKITLEELERYEQQLLGPPKRSADHTTDPIKPGEVGPNGYRIGYTAEGDKVEWLPGDDDPGEEWPMILRRNDNAIREAESEFMDVIWYDRKLVLQNNLKEGSETIDPEIEKGMLSAMRSVERKYGKRKLRNYYHDDFEWGMLNGKLSALRWVMGDDWDMLDT